MKIPSNPFAEDAEDLRHRHFYIMMVATLFFLMLGGRLWYLQIIRGGEFRQRSENNRTRIQETLPPRGLILDRNGYLLVDNSPHYDLAIIREDVRDEKELIGRLCHILGMSYEELSERYDEIRRKPSFKPAVLVRDVTDANRVILETHRYELQGTVIQVKPQRRYLNEFLASHIIGYLGEINSNQLADELYREHRMGDLVGQYGVEREWESYLHGRRGWRLVEVNARGRLLKVIKQVNPVAGRNLHLTLDSGLQQVAQDALGEQVGAIVAVDPRTGEVLAMASSPTFNQKDFEGGISTEKWNELVNNPFHPLENRAISGQYPPGSTFKIISAIAGLEEGAVQPDTLIACKGAFPFGDRVFHCWNSRYGHGMVDMHRSLRESCDIYYYEVGLRVGVDRLSDYSHAFGLGQKTGIGLPAERPGLVPTKAWKKNRYKIPWRPGETLSVIIGQGYNMATPLQMAMVTSTIANGGIYYKPHIVRMFTDAGGKVVKFMEPEVVRRLKIKPENLAAVRKGLAGVVNEPGGTATRVKMDDIVVAGKTGTSQVVTLKRYRSTRDEDRPYKYRDHAWFVAFAPLEDPRIAVAVVVEHAGHGGQYRRASGQEGPGGLFRSASLGRAAQRGRSQIHGDDG